MLAQGAHWRAELRKDGAAVALSLHKEVEPEDVRDLRIEVPLDDWQRVLRVVRGDRKLLGGILLDFARNKDRLGAALASDRLFLGLERAVVDATLTLVEREVLTLAPEPQKS